jgi:MFS family permease
MQPRVTNPWVVCLIAASFFFYQFIQITMFNILKPELIIEFNADPAILSFISALYFYGTVLFLIPAGIMLDHISTRKIILATMGISLIGLLIFAMSTSILGAGIGRFLVGISGGPFCFLSSMRIASRWFPEQRLAFVTGVIVAMAMFGGMVAQLPLSILVAEVGWRTAMYVNLGLGAILLGLIYLYVYDYPPGKKHEYEQQMAYNRTQGFAQGFKIVVFKAQNWNCGLFASLLNLPILVFGALWGFMYVTQIFNLSRLQASTSCTMLFLGMLLGGPMFGWISDRMLVRKTPMFAGLLLCFTAIAILLLTPSLGFFGVASLMFLIGVGSSAQILAYPTVTDSNPPALVGSALGLASTLVMAGGAIIQPAVGWLVEYKWDGLIEAGMPIFSYSNYNFAFWSMPLAIIIATCLVFLIKETNCKSSA